ncbi:MAG: ferritin-like domain-containing protein [Butyrivibrio sp.]|nr:ferritin-like domain-containing protein [Butyrivibrio sp.]
MELKEKERTVLQDLQTQEKSCVEKYKRYAAEACDKELRDLFTKIQEAEQKHYDSITGVLNGDEVPSCNCNDCEGKNYNPSATYDKNEESEDKKMDCFLATDCIGSEKLVSSEYNSDVFVFGSSAIRKLLADIMIEEQNHAEMLWKYKTVNGMA